MAEKTDRHEHEFMVAAVEAARDDTLDGVAVTLVDARGGRVRLHMDTDMAEILRERISAALSKTVGP
ncbi:hypothetical protein [Aminobacter carboxidus]|uniref:Uncharacterized protein n=1 Tax=Aminobacter carboxidus TaxID=376165 RepID=A0A8E2BF40_9HYPH|nr:MULTISPECIES: hypothetical protein [Aminobacter carboxidus group]MBB6467515.1 hypothetical protein [Aminobacter lissarensis]MBE1206377.1 hypothetical protein [Aminobacter carboxidus]